MANIFGRQCGEGGNRQNLVPVAATKLQNSTSIGLQCSPGQYFNTPNKIVNPNESDYFTRYETTLLLSGKANVSDVYTKAETDEKLDLLDQSVTDRINALNSLPTDNFRFGILNTPGLARFEPAQFVKTIGSGGVVNISINQSLFNINWNALPVA